MFSISEMPRTSTVELPQEQIRITLVSDPCPPEEVVQNLASIEGPVDIYCWYEGTQGLPQAGAFFMKKSIFEPLFALKKNAKLYLYSLKSWDFKKNTKEMPASTPLGDTINRINTSAIECIYSSSFFRYCTQISKKNPLYNYVKEELPKKDWLTRLSKSQQEKGVKIAELFDNQSSLFDYTNDSDVSFAYSSMQYVEGYYLIQKSIREGLEKKQKKIDIAFVLPNDEGKYYQDFPKEVERMLKLDFGHVLDNIEINVTFQFFKYGEDVDLRPYIDKRPKAPKVKPKEIGSYFDYLPKAPLAEPPKKQVLESAKEPSLVSQKKQLLELPREPFLRDVIHGLNNFEPYPGA